MNFCFLFLIKKLIVKGVKLSVILQTIDSIYKKILKGFFKFRKKQKSFITKKLILFLRRNSIVKPFKKVLRKSILKGKLFNKNRCSFLEDKRSKRRYVLERKIFRKIWSFPQDQNEYFEKLNYIRSSSRGYLRKRFAKNFNYIFNWYINYNFIRSLNKKISLNYPLVFTKKLNRIFNIRKWTPLKKLSKKKKIPQGLSKLVRIIHTFLFMQRKTQTYLYGKKSIFVPTRMKINISLKVLKLLFLGNLIGRHKRFNLFQLFSFKIGFFFDKYFTFSSFDSNFIFLRNVMQKKEENKVDFNLILNLSSYKNTFVSIMVRDLKYKVSKLLVKLSYGLLPNQSFILYNFEKYDYYKFYGYLLELVFDYFYYLLSQKQGLRNFENRFPIFPSKLHRLTAAKFVYKRNFKKLIRNYSYKRRERAGLSIGRITKGFRFFLNFNYIKVNVVLKFVSTFSSSKRAKHFMFSIMKVLFRRRFKIRRRYLKMKKRELWAIKAHMLYKA